MRTAPVRGQRCDPIQGKLAQGNLLSQPRQAARAGISASRSRSVSRVAAASLSSLIANRVTSKFEKDVLKVGQNRAKIRNPDPILGKTMNHLGHEIVAPAANGEPPVIAYNSL